MLANGHRFAATLGRLALRLAIVPILSTLWSGDSPAQAASVLSLPLQWQFCGRPALPVRGQNPPGLIKGANSQ